MPTVRQWGGSVWCDPKHIYQLMEKKIEHKVSSKPHTRHKK